MRPIHLAATAITALGALFAMYVQATAQEGGGDRSPPARTLDISRGARCHEIWHHPGF